MFNSIIGKQKVKHIVEMCLEATVFSNAVVYKDAAVKEYSLYIILCGCEMGII